MQLAGTVPTVVDRVIQQAIAQVLGPIFDPGFSDASFGFRPGRSAHGALRQVQTYIGEGYRIAVDLDLAKFFDNVQHDVLMARVGRKVRDKRLLKLAIGNPLFGIAFGQWEPFAGDGIEQLGAKDLGQGLLIEPKWSS